jgi:hypothetical protein
VEGEGRTGLCDITAQSVSVQINRFLFSLVHCVIETVDARYYVRKTKTREETATSMAFKTSFKNFDRPRLRSKRFSRVQNSSSAAAAK